MRKLLRIIAVLAVLCLAAVSFAGCVSVTYGGMGSTGLAVVRAEGEKVSTQLDGLGDFTGIDISASVRAEYIAGECGVSMEMQENLMEYIDVSVENGVLVIKSDRMFSFGRSADEPVIYVTAPALDYIMLAGAVDLYSEDPLSADSVSISISGGCEVDMIMDVNSLDINSSGAAELDFSGRADSFSAFGSGGCEVRAFELETKTAELNFSGAGFAEISCSDELDVTISGGGEVAYKGNPVISQNISGVGEINQVRD